MVENERALPIKRYRRDETKNDSDDEWDAGDDVQSNRSKFVLYVSVKERRKQKLVKLGRMTEIQADDVDIINRAMVCVSPDSGASSGKEDNEGGLGTDRNDTNNDIAKQELEKKEEDILAKSKDRSLLLQHFELKRLAEARQESERDKQLKEEEKILRSLAENTALRSAAELAKGIQYIDPIKTSWTPPSRIIAKGDQRHQRIRKQQNILIEGDNPPPPLTTFADMKLNKGILKGIYKLSCVI